MIKWRKNYTSDLSNLKERLENSKALITNTYVHTLNGGELCNQFPTVRVRKVGWNLLIMTQSGEPSAISHKGRFEGKRKTAMQLVLTNLQLLVLLWGIMPILARISRPKVRISTI